MGQIFSHFAVTPGIWLPPILGKQKETMAVVRVFTSRNSVLLNPFWDFLGSTPNPSNITNPIQSIPAAGAFLPAATLVSKGSVKIDAAKAAEHALRTLHHIRRMNPHPVEPGDPPAPSVVNQNGIQKVPGRNHWMGRNMETPMRRFLAENE